MVHYYGVRPWYVYARFDDCRRKEYVEFALLETAHLSCESAAVHLAVGDDDPGVGDDSGEALFRLADRGDAVVQKEHLAASGELCVYRVADDVVRVRDDSRLDGDSFSGWRPEQRKVSRAGHGQIERARYGVAESVSTSAVALRRLRNSLWRTPKRCSSSIMTSPRSRKEGVRADGDIAHSRRDSLERALVGKRTLKARHRLYSYRRAVES